MPTNVELIRTIEELLSDIRSYENYNKIGLTLSKLQQKGRMFDVQSILPKVITELNAWKDEIVFYNNDTFLDVNETTIGLVFLVYNQLSINCFECNSSYLEFLMRVNLFIKKKVDFLPYFPASKMGDIPLVCLVDDEASSRFFSQDFLDAKHEIYRYMYRDCSRVFRNYTDTIVAMVLTNNNPPPKQSFNRDEFALVTSLIERHYDRILDQYDWMHIKEIELSEHLIQTTLPNSLREFYLSFGRVGIPFTDHHIKPPWRLKENLLSDSNILLFCVENQGLCAWGVLDDHSVDNPIVYKLLPYGNGTQDPVSEKKQIDIQNYWKYIQSTDQVFSEFILWLAS